jgi:hypothetical protein
MVPKNWAQFRNNSVDDRCISSYWMGSSMRHVYLIFYNYLTRSFIPSTKLCIKIMYNMFQFYISRVDM